MTEPGVQHGCASSRQRLHVLEAGPEALAADGGETVLFAGFGYLPFAAVVVAHDRAEQSLGAIEAPRAAA